MRRFAEVTKINACASTVIYGLRNIKRCAKDMRIGDDIRILGELKEIISTGCDGHMVLCERLQNVAIGVANMAVERAEFAAKTSEDPVYTLNVELARKFQYYFSSL